MDKDRLTILRDALRAPLPERTKFNLGVWRRENECGTVCCAVGLAMGMPEFQALGLIKSPAWSGAVPQFATAIGFNAAASLFAVTYAQAVWLFDPDNYQHDARTLPTEVADRIDALMTGGNLAKAKRIMGGRS